MVEGDRHHDADATIDVLAVLAVVQVVDHPPNRFGRLALPMAPVDQHHRLALLRQQPTQFSQPELVGGRLGPQNRQQPLRDAQGLGQAAAQRRCQGPSSSHRNA